jgi:hypothetical protein
MSTPNQGKQGPQQSRGGGSGPVVAIVVALSVTMILGCLGACGGIAFLARTKIESAMAEAGVPLPAVISMPPATDWNDWMVRRELTHLYQTSLESVAADNAVVDKLGGPVETVLDAEELFRRRDNGALNRFGEHIEFDVMGPKATGKVAVES